MSDLSAYLAAAVLLALSAYRLGADHRTAPHRAAARRAHQAQRYGYALVMCFALAMAMLAPSTPTLLAGLGVDRAAVILLGEAARTSAVSLLMFVACALGRRPLRGLPILAALLTQLAMLTLFLAARPAVAADGLVFTYGAGRYLLASHDLVFACYAEWSLAALLRALRREGRRPAGGPLRIGIRLWLAACAVAVVWTAWTADDIVHVVGTGTQDGSEDLVSNALGALCALLIAGGALVTKWHAALASVRARARTYLTYRRLTPLWTALSSEFPQIALEHGRRPWGGARLSPAGLDFALYRRVIEIHDGRLALRPHTPGRALIADNLARTRPGEGSGAGEESGMGGAIGAGREALIEAASIAAALENRRAGRRCPQPHAGQAPAPRAAGASAAVDAEAAWLAQVSTAYARICGTAQKNPRCGQHLPDVPGGSVS